MWAALFRGWCQRPNRLTFLAPFVLGKPIVTMTKSGKQQQAGLQGRAMTGCDGIAHSCPQRSDTRGTARAEEMRVAGLLGCGGHRRSGALAPAPWQPFLALPFVPDPDPNFPSFFWRPSNYLLVTTLRKRTNSSS